MSKPASYPDPIMIERFNQLKNESGLTDEQIGHKLQVNKYQVCKWRMGIAIPNSLYIRRMAIQFNVSADWIFGLSDRRERK